MIIELKKQNSLNDNGNQNVNPNEHQIDHENLNESANTCCTLGPPKSYYKFLVHTK